MATEVGFGVGTLLAVGVEVAGAIASLIGGVEAANPATLDGPWRSDCVGTDVAAIDRTNPTITRYPITATTCFHLAPDRNPGNQPNRRGLGFPGGVDAWK